MYRTNLGKAILLIAGILIAVAFYSFGKIQAYENIKYISMSERVDENLALDREAKSETTSSDRLRELAALNDDLAQIVASNISAPPELLKDLAFHKNQAVRKAVVRNSNTPIETLFILGEYFPRDLLNNPVFEFLTLEDLKFVEKISSGAIASLIQQPNVPEFLLKYAASHKDKTIAYMAKMSVAISGEMNEGWHEEAAIVIRETHLKYDILDNYFDEKEVNKFLVSSELLPNFLEFIPPVILNNLEFRRNLGKNSNATPNWLRQLANDSTRWIRNGVAKNPNTPLDILELLSRDRNYMVRRDVLENTNTTVEIVESLANDSSTEVRSGVAKNHKTPTYKLKLLAGDPSEQVRMQVAANPNTPAAKLELLANDEDPTVSQLAAKNPNTPDKILESLAKDSSEDKRGYIAENIGTPISILELLATDSDRWVRYYVATNPNTPLNILKSLATDSDNSVRSGVAKNPNTSLDILEFLATDL